MKRGTTRLRGLGVEPEECIPDGTMKTGEGTSTGAADGTVGLPTGDGHATEGTADGTGSDGSDGSAGNRGSDGSDGGDGSDGNHGNQGNQGSDGSDGSDGNRGSDCSDGSDGSDGDVSNRVSVGAAETCAGDEDEELCLSDCGVKLILKAVESSSSSPLPQTQVSRPGLRFWTVPMPRPCLDGNCLPDRN